MVKKLLESIESAFHIPSLVPSRESMEDKLGASTMETSESLNRMGGQSVASDVRCIRRRARIASNKTNDLQIAARCIEMTMGGLLADGLVGLL